jgi:poly(A) polymerase
MGRPPDHLPAPPDLPSFRIESTPEERGRNANGGGHDGSPPGERHAGTGLVRHDVALDEARLDADAARVVRRLERGGFQAYLVGGCVRDLLLGGTPKDYDIATSARPEDVRAMFRNCRVIGRRFRLAHVLFGGGKIVEVATFRRSPQTELEPDDVDGTDDLLIRSDNVFGDAHEDAIRRDFTINALFYDLDRRQVLDWCGGMDGVARRTIHTIGDPIVRFREDPIRILRAIKFAARLDLGIEPDVYDAMVSCREELAKAARPRVFEEILRLMRGGAAHRSMWLLWEIGAMAILLPELSAFLDDDEATAGRGERFWRKLAIIDQRTKQRGKALDDTVLWATLLSEPLEEASAGAQDPGEATADFLEPIVDRVAMPRRISDAIRRIRMMLPRLAQGKGGRLLKNEVARDALDVLEIELECNGQSLAGLAQMRDEAAAFTPAVSVGAGRRMGRFRGGRARAPRGS